MPFELFAFGFGRRFNSVRDQDDVSHHESSHESSTEGDGETFERPNMWQTEWPLEKQNTKTIDVTYVAPLTDGSQVFR